MTFIGENLPPVLFLTLMAVCALSIVAAAVLDVMPQKEPGTRDQGDTDEEGGSKLSKAEVKKAKAEAKARKKEERARKKAETAAAKAAKGGKAKKGKSQPQTTPEATEDAASSEPAGETIDFSMPDQQ